RESFGMNAYPVGAAARQSTPSGACATEIREHIPDARDLLLNGLGGSGVTALTEAALLCNARPLLFAGAVRDAILTIEHRRAPSLPRDFDVGLLGLTRETFDGLLRELRAQPNRYGGYRLIPS